MVFQIDVRDLKLACECLGDLLLGQVAAFYQHTTKPPSAPLLFIQRGTQLLRSDQILLNQDVAEENFFQFRIRSRVPLWGMASVLTG